MAGAEAGLCTPPLVVKASRDINGRGKGFGRLADGTEKVLRQSDEVTLDVVSQPRRPDEPAVRELGGSKAVSTETVAPEATPTRAGGDFEWSSAPQMDDNGGAQVFGPGLVDERSRIGPVRLRCASPVSDSQETCHRNPGWLT